MKKVAKNANVDVAEPNKEWVLSNPNECPFQKELRGEEDEI